MNYVTILQIVVPIVATGLGYLLTLVFKTPSAEVFLKSAVAIVYPIVDKIAAATPNTIDDKIALAIDALNDYYNGHNKTLTQADVETAKQLFTQMSGGK